MALEHVFSPGQIGTLTLKNRFVLAPMGSGMADQEMITEPFIQYHVLRAKGGVGLNIVEYTAVHPTTRNARIPSLYDDRFIAGMQQLTSAVHAAGGKIGVQLWHAGRQTSSRITGRAIIAPSAVPSVVYQEMPEEMSRESIQEIVNAFGDAALRAKQAGFDMVELHGASGYLLNQFMSAYSNAREDEYGGSLQNRARFAMEVIQNIKQKAGADFPVSYRVTINEHVPGGLVPEDIIEVSPWLEQAGADVIHVTSGILETVHETIAPLEKPAGFNAGFSARIKQAVRIPVMVVGRINDPAVAEQIVSGGQADFVALGRTLIADPAFCIKAREGRSDDIIKCIGCNQSCISGQRPDPEADRNYGPVCLRNPVTGREYLFTDEPAGESKRILVIGGGAAGMTAALRLQNRGHQVTLCEKTDMLGGQLYLAGQTPSKAEMAEAALQMGRQISRSGAEILLNTPADAALIEALQPDEVIIATGSVPFIPNIPGNERSHVKTAHEVLRGGSTGERVAIIGGGLVGMEVAELLVSQGKHPIIVEMLNEVAKELVSSRKVYAMEFIAGQGVPVYVHTKCIAIGETDITLEQAGTRFQLKDIDTVVMATGSRSLDQLSGLLEEKRLPFHIIGDALQPRKALEAIYEGAMVAQMI
ncbi:FAD-dependent oxidoreductase [Paenibacillus tepidiphilus]|uniref:FAD-dependent oxidoreductase n=1 Tax=Paenibacillus tepidiphilus TaxID=2608683 RepID=UPI00123B61C8|nr:FAD-dependent oxidoreductase [Paenibacillus tepidiphilus]